ncbi:hypothetical protein GCM10007874_05470 [Labrys miyagiensis]|uniref:Uncharacterized protein n=1 Tax=Labrys miyagiensis TaxID=346912 RepID=A0ABQ6CH01_9HYPH|nr:hypothetical protein GCM10007874_05470 [Labrys miyagiensis]
MPRRCWIACIRERLVDPGYAVPEGAPGGYYRPQARFELKRPVSEARIGQEAQDKALAARLWSLSEKLTGVIWPTPQASFV